MSDTNEIKLYGLFDAALMPKVWLNLDAWSLPYEPLYRNNYQPIAEAIPYLILLDKTIDKNAVEELLNAPDYRQGLLISSALALDKLVEQLAYFYHVVDKQNRPCLRRFFDLRNFANFLATLTPAHCAYLFEHQTAFYYNYRFDDYYHSVRYQGDQLHWFQMGKFNFDSDGNGA